MVMQSVRVYSEVKVALCYGIKEELVGLTFRATPYICNRLNDGRTLTMIIGGRTYFHRSVRPWSVVEMLITLEQYGIF